MAWSLDARVPVRFGSLADATGEDALLLEGGTPPGPFPAARFDASGPQHQAGCACCLSRNPAAEALGGLFQARAKGEVGFFRRVLAVTSTAEGDTAVWAALRSDPLVMARFRME